MARLVSAAARSLASLRGNVSISSPTLSLSLPLALPFLPSPSSDRARHSRTRMERPPAGRPRSLTHPGWQAEARGGRTNERPSERVSKPLSSFPSDDRPTTQPFLAASPHWPEAREGERAGLFRFYHHCRTARVLTSPSQPTQRSTAGLTVAAMPMRWRRRRRRHAILPPPRRSRLFVLVVLAKLVFLFLSSSHILPPFRSASNSLSLPRPSPRFGRPRARERASKRLRCSRLVRRGDDRARRARCN